MRLETRFFRELKARLEETRATEMVYLADGSAKSFEDYRFRTGKLQGLQEAIDIAENIEQNLTSSAKKHQEDS